MSDTEKKTVNLSEFNAGLVIQNFFVDPDDKAAQQAMRFKFKLLRGEIASTRNNITDRIEEISQIVIDTIEFPYYLYKDYIEDFFPKKIKPDHEALIIAVICNHDIISANEPLQMSEEEQAGDAPQRHRNDGFDQKILDRAFGYFDEALDIEKGIIPEDGTVTFEGSYLAHINAMTAVCQKDENFDDLEFYELQEFLGTTIAKIPGFVRLNTDLGQQLQRAADDLSARINTLMAPEPTPPASRGSHLRLVQP